MNEPVITRFEGIHGRSANDLLRPQIDPYRAYLALIPRMVVNARRAREVNATSYRDFKVGADVMAVDEFGMPHNYAGENIKLHENFPKYCAERFVLDEALRDGARKAIGMVVAATDDVDLIRGVTGQATPTLDSCEPCIDHMDRSPIVDKDFLVLTTGTDKDHYQIHTLAELEATYQGKGSGVENTHRYVEHNDFNFENWSQVLYMYDFMASAEADYNNHVYDARHANIARIALAGSV